MGVALDLERRRQPRFDYDGLANYVVSAAHRQGRLRKAGKKADSARNGSGKSKTGILEMDADTGLRV